MRDCGPGLAREVPSSQQPERIHEETYCTVPCPATPWLYASRECTLPSLLLYVSLHCFPFRFQQRIWEGGQWDVGIGVRQVDPPVGK